VLARLLAVFCLRIAWSLLEETGRVLLHTP
jgi:hypothetical protein